MTSETIKLNLIPGCELPVLHASQFDDGRALSFEIYDGEELFTSFDAYDISLHARKVDGTIIGIDTYNVDSENHQVIFFTTEQLTACAGKNICELVFTDSISGSVVGSCNFWLEVEGDPYSGGIDSASDIENLSTQIAAIVDSQLDNYYTKEEIDDQIETIVTEQVTPIVSGIVAEQVPPAVQAELGNYYTKSETDSAFYDKSEVDILLSGKADTSDLPDMTNYYDKATTDTLLASKANTSTTYTKTEVDNLIAAIPSNDITTEITIPASVQTFNDGGDNIPLKSLVTEIVPIQAGSGVPSPSNVRSISGWQNINVVRCGKNLCPYIEQGSINQTTGQDQPSNDVKRSDYIRIKPTFTICISGFTNNASIRAFWYGKNKEYLGNVVLTNSATNIVIANSDISFSDVYYIRFQAISSLISNSMQVEWGSTPTTYEAYNGNTTTIPLGSTVYGGSLECVEGEGQITWGMVTLNQFDFSTLSTPENHIFRAEYQNVLTNFDAPSASTVVTSAICERFNAKSYQDITLADDGCFSISRFNVNRINFIDSGASTVEQFLQRNGSSKLVFPLATPTSLSTSGANIPTLSGVNNIYTDSGDIQSLEYFNNKADDIAAMISLMTRS